MKRHYIDIESPESLVMKEDEVRAPGDGELLVAVDFAGVNRGDLLQRIGLYPPPEDASPVMGLEVSGEVVAVGPGVEGYEIGDRVASLTHGGGYASMALAKANHSFKLPAGMDTQTGAALPEALLTVWANVFERGNLKKGETLFVSGGTSGIGTMAIQMACLYGARVVSMAGSDDKCMRLKELGAAFAFNYREQDIAAAMLDAGLAGQIDVTFDMVGGDFTRAAVDFAAVDGRIVCIGVMGGMTSEISVVNLFMKRLTLTGSTLRRMETEAKTQALRDMAEKVIPACGSGEIAPQIHSVLPLSQALEAHNTMQAGNHVGKILLDCRGDAS